MAQLTDEQAREIGRLIAEGFTSGRLDAEQENTGTFVVVAWELKTNIWTED